MLSLAELLMVVLKVGQSISQLIVVRVRFDHSEIPLLMFLVFLSYRQAEREHVIR